MTPPRTLLEMAGANLAPAALEKASLVLVDLQNEYLDGPLAVAGGTAAVARARAVLSAARAAGSPVIHIAHKGRAGGPFDRDAPRGQIIADVAPEASEPVIEKPLPNAFARTTLGDALAATGRTEIILCGFMTHMCISSTARAALDHDYRVTIVAEACATRDLPDGRGGAIAAATIHDIALAELADRFAIIARGAPYGD